MGEKVTTTSAASWPRSTPAEGEKETTSRSLGGTSNWKATGIRDSLKSGKVRDTARPMHVGDMYLRGGAR